MSKVKFFFKKLLSADVQVLIEADYLTADGGLTDDGIRALNQIQFIELQAQLVERAKERVAERAANEAKKQ